MSNQINPVFDVILQNHSLVDYLSARGLTGVNCGNKLRYSCPLHGPEKSPSFYVYLGENEQHFYCYGCKKFGDVINIVSELEHLSIHEAIKKLSNGLSIPQEQLDRYISEKKIKAKDSQTVEDLSFKFSLLFKKYLETTDSDKDELEFLESVYEKIDKMIVAADRDGLIKLYNLIDEKEVLTKRRIFFVERKEKEVEHILD